MSTPPMPMPLASHSSSESLIKSLLLRWSPSKHHSILCQLVERSCNGVEIPHETPVKTCKTKKTTNLRDRSQKWPARDGNNLCLIHLNALRCNNITKKRHSIGAKGALLKVTEQTCLAQDIKNSTQMLKMFIMRLAVNEDIIKRNHHEFTNE